VILTAILAILINFANAQWQQTNGPYGGHIRSIAVNGSNIIAGTEDGVYLSTNNGSDWEAKNTGITNTYIMSMANLGAKICAGTCGDGVF